MVYLIIEIDNKAKRVKEISFVININSKIYIVIDENGYDIFYL
jgi:hypothetical protein